MAIFIFPQHKSITDLEKRFANVHVYLDSHGSEHDGVVASNSISHTSLNTENNKVRKQACDNVIMLYIVCFPCPSHVKLYTDNILDIDLILG